MSSGRQSRSRGLPRIGGFAVAGCAALTLLLGAVEASAKPFLRGFSEDLYKSSNEDVRLRWFDAAVDAHANIVRIDLSWNGILDGRRPADPRNPADPAYDWSLVDAAIGEATARGLRVLVTVSFAPGWAEGPNVHGFAPPGTWKPDPDALGAFGEALARRYSGSFAGPTGVLPRVEFYEAWNEPNLADFLAPQWQDGKPFAPEWYRRMLNAFYAGVKSADPSAKVIGPGTAPYGDPPSQERRIRPLLFYRELLCLKGRQKLDPTSCPDPAMLDIISHHPINLVGGADTPAANPDDLTVPDMGRLRKTVRAAERAGNLLPGGSHPLWVSELWWLTNPPRVEGVSPSKQAAYLEEALYLLWKQGVQAVIWYQLTDDGPTGDAFESGLFFADGRPKPGLTAFKFPFVTDPGRKGKATAWGIAPESGRLSIQRRSNGRWQTIKKIRVTGGNPFDSQLRLPRKATLRAQVGGARSLVWKQS